MPLNRNLLIFFLFIFVTSFTELKSNSVSDLLLKACDDDSTYELSIGDVAIPPKTCFYLKKTIFLNARQGWFGKFYFDSKLDLDSVFNHFKKHMPDKGWIILTEQRSGSQGEQDGSLIYEKDRRIATIIIKEKDYMSEFILSVNPSARSSS